MDRALQPRGRRAYQSTVLPSKRNTGMSKRPDRAGPCARVLAITLGTAALAGVAAVQATSPPLPACALADAPRADLAMRVPFEQVDGRIYVQARVNGRGPFRFAIDTGASGVGRADSSLVAALGLPVLAPTANSDGLSTAQADTTRLATLEVGGLVHADVQVITRDYNSGLSAQAALAGIVARGFFADGLLIIDYRRRTLAFSRTLALAPGQDGVLAYTRPFRVPLTIGGVQAQGNLDTGADVAFVLPRAVFEQVGGTPLQAAGRGQLANGRIETWRSTVPGPFRIGLARLADVEVRVVERFPEVLVGAKALQDLVVLIDQRSNAVALCP